MHKVRLTNHQLTIDPVTAFVTSSITMWHVHDSDPYHNLRMQTTSHVCAAILHFQIWSSQNEKNCFNSWFKIRRRTSFTAEFITIQPWN